MRVFKEEQRFTQTWLLILLGISIIIPILVLLKNFFEENSSMSVEDLLLSSAFIIVCIIPIYFLKLTTRIDETGIHYQFFPFHLSLKTISWSVLTAAQTRTYDAISEYGGWGLKGDFLRKKGKRYAYTVSGNTGLQLTFKNGKQILIGTKKQKDVAFILTTYASKITNNEN